MTKLLVIAVAYIAAPAGAAGQSSPFRGLHELDSVTTSNDEYGVWITVPAVGYRLQLPGRPVLDMTTGPGDDFEVWLGLQCRANGTAEGYSAGVPAAATLWIPMHPAAPAVPGALHPLYWLLGLTGRELARTPVEIRLADVTYQGELARRRIAYGQRRPDQRIDLQPGEVLALVALGDPWTLSAIGEGVDIHVAFSRPAEGVRSTAAMMREHCPPANAAPNTIR